ncbi:Protein of unknown function [Propionibacterium freudenreichii]|nr:Protein of unknown function [Propionibacterium freudenreichii]
MIATDPFAKYSRDDSSRDQG